MEVYPPESVGLWPYIEGVVVGLYGAADVCSFFAALHRELASRA